MTTTPSREARAASIPTDGNSRSPDGPGAGSQNQVGPAANDAVASPEQQDVDQASVELVTSKPTSASGDQDSYAVAEGHSQEPREASNTLQMSTSPQDPAWDGQGQDSRMIQGLQTSQRDSLAGEETPQSAGIPDREQESAPTTPSAEVQPSRTVDAQPMGSAADTASQPRGQDTSATESMEADPEHLEPVSLDTEALPGAESQGVTEGDLGERSRDLRRPSVAPGGSGPPSPGPQEVALGGRSLDSSLCMANEEDSYMRSMTSLLGGGEGSISSLADVLVWSETTVGMASALLASGHSSVTDLLHSPGPSLRSVSSILGSTFSSGLMAGTSLALRSVTHLLERVEQRTLEGVRLAVRYLTSHLAPQQAHASPNSG
nr:testis-expressed protein 44-like [Vulpes vulpes]